ncbi:glycosyltransferase [Stenotrophomonas sp. GD04145]|uniref:glycosyltransferase family 2 protein n=1 Tax=Stenotrophomonas sp. GD04145 TaxID=2975436 RepID=UPI0024493F67|nr:glycosyltransferase family 2 protein [Stenotrophomonas sp. GD04145]MDH0170902.1 glycosyltransferase [Stenotrophomonas sp. GD04145]
MPPFFSIVIPTYNRSSTILPTLLSVQGQTFSDFECIIVDDGSKDVDALTKLVDQLADRRFRVIQRPNGGGGAARNTGIEAAVGLYIAFLDSDDFFVPEKLELFHAYLRRSPYPALYSYAKVDRGIPDRMWIRPDRPIREDESMASYLFIANQFVQTSTIVMDSSLAKRVKFNPELRKGQDLDFCLRVDVDGTKFRMLEQPLIVWTDISEVGRTSRHAGSAAPAQWLNHHAHMMTPAEIIGYRATVLSYYQPKHRFLVVLKDLVQSVTVAKVPPKVALRHWLRFMLPRSLYRSIVSVAIRSLKQKGPSSSEFQE